MCLPQNHPPDSSPGQQKPLAFTINKLTGLQNTALQNEISGTVDRFKIIWISTGNGCCHIDLKKYRIKNNQLFFIQPGQVYQLQTCTELDGYFISFTASFFEIDHLETYTPYNTLLFQLLANANGIEISDELQQELTGITKRMIKEFNSDQPFRDELIKRYLKIYLIYLSRQLAVIFETTRLTRNMELVQQFLSLLDKHYTTEKTVAGYARWLAVTPNYINEIIKKTTGFSAGYHIRQRIVLEAKRQAIYSDTCMKQIGYRLGFNDMAHFSKFFKSATGINFTDFKKEKLVIAM